MNDMLNYYYPKNEINEKQLHIPEWAKNEHLERIVPLKKLWKLKFGKEKTDKTEKPGKKELSGKIRRKEMLMKTKRYKLGEDL